MIPAIRSELRKLLTVRSLYVLILISVLFVALFAGYAEGYKAAPLSLLDPGKLSTETTNAIGGMAVFGALAVVLLVTNEYRYNTILYTLTSSRSRLKVLFAKIVVATGFALLFTLFIGALSPVLNIVGMRLGHHQAVHQVFYYKDLLWHCLFYGWAYAMLGLFMAFIIRNQIGAIVALFLVPSTLENILMLVLKHNAVYLPFKALGNVLVQSPDLRPTKAAAVVAAYLVAGWIVAAVLFVRRDAN